MAIALRGSPTTATGTEGSGSTLVINKPTGVVENDVMIAWVVWDTTPTITASGWTQITGSPMSNSDQRGAFWYKVAGASEPSTYTFSGTSFDRAGGIIAFSGVDTSTPVEAQGNQTNSSTSSVTAPTITTLTDGAMLVFAGMMDDSGGSGVTGTAPGGMTERVDVQAGSWSWAYMATEIKATAGATGTRVATASISDDNGGFLIALKPAATFTLEQEGFAFGDDDGSESAHTLDTQDTNYSGALGVKTLRLLANATDDPDNLAYKLKYQKDGAGGYEDVPLVATAPETMPSFVGFSGAGGTGAVDPGLPAGIQDDDILILTIEGEGEDANADSAPSGGDWTAIDGSTGSVASGTTGNADKTRNTCYWHRYDSGSPPNTSVPDAGQHTLAVITAWRNCIASGNPIDVTQSSTDGTNDSNASLTGTTTTDDNCLIVCIATSGDNNGSAYPAVGRYSSWTNSNLASPGITEAVDVGTNAGSDGQIGIAYGGLATAGAIGTTTASMSTSEEEANWVIALKPKAAETNEVYVSASGNVAAGGEATTARLTAPSTKTTGDFDTGRRWDDENGTDSIDITADDYTELEWVLTTQSPASGYYEFRLYRSDTAFDTYTVTPKWTISSDITGAASVSGSATIAAVGTVGHAADAAVTGNATLAATASKEAPGVASLSGNVTIAATASKEAPGVASVSGNATIGATAAVDHTGILSVSGNATLAASATVDHAATASVSGNATLAAAGTVTSGDVEGAAAFTATKTMVATATVDHAAILAVSGSAVLSASGTVDHAADAAVSGSLVLAASASKEAPGQASVSGSISIAATASKTAPGQAALTGNATINATATVEHAAVLAVTGSASIVATGQSDLQASTSLNAVAVLSAIGTVELLATVPNLPGLEYTIPDGLIHYTMDERKLHATLPENRVHHTMNNGRLHATLPDNKLHYTLDEAA